MKTAPIVFAAFMAFVVSTHSQVADVVDSREPAQIPLTSPATARILGDLADGTAPPTAPEKPEFIVAAKDIISTKTVQQGDRTITIQRIKPIPMPQSVPVPAPEPLEISEQAAMLERATEISEPQPKWDFLMVAATVFQFMDAPPRTMVTYWPGGMGESVTFWSSADFRLLEGFTNFVAADGHAYSIMLMLNNEETASTADLQASDGPQLPDFPNGKATFTLGGDAPADPQLLAPFKALHDIYNNEQPRLLLAWQGRERARLQREAELKANPPESRDVTIRYWRTERPAPAKGGVR
jgi:hypothetical protein